MNFKIMALDCYNWHLLSPVPEVFSPSFLFVVLHPGGLWNGTHGRKLLQVFFVHPFDSFNVALQIRELFKQGEPVFVLTRLTQMDVMLA